MLKNLLDEKYGHCHERMPATDTDLTEDDSSDSSDTTVCPTGKTRATLTRWVPPITSPLRIDNQICLLQRFFHFCQSLSDFESCDNFRNCKKFKSKFDCNNFKNEPFYLRMNAEFVKEKMFWMACQISLVLARVSTKC